MQVRDAVPQREDVCWSRRLGQALQERTPEDIRHHDAANP
jgi:hypothetical protein